MLQMAADGYSYAEIGRIFMCDHTSIMYQCRKHGVKLKSEVHIDYYTINDLAEKLGRCRSTIHDYINTGKLKTCNQHGMGIEVHVSVSEFEKFMKEKTIKISKPKIVNFIPPPRKQIEGYKYYKPIIKREGINEGKETYEDYLKADQQKKIIRDEKGNIIKVESINVDNYFETLKNGENKRDFDEGKEVDKVDTIKENEG